MHLEKLEIHGFKSFASKNALVFPRPTGGKKGITAIVGPNGSGKSNIADSVRWALGEQSMKMLRGKRSEDVIFAGSDKKGKLSMAEVSLYLNNEDKKAPIEYDSIVISRRIYRGGESEYLLNGNRVRLFDIEMLLARASFGQRTYSVIGQGTVEGFLNNSLAERKEFFDEATGVKQYQIKRDDSLNKLKASYENLVQGQALLAEISPLLASLTRQVNRLKRRGELEEELKDIQGKYYSESWQELNSVFDEASKSLLNAEKEAREKEKKLNNLNRELEKHEAEGGVGEEFRILQSAQAELNKKRDEVVRRLAAIDARQEARLEASGKFDLSWLNSKKEELISDLKNIESEIISSEEELVIQDKQLKDFYSQKASLEEKIRALSAKSKEESKIDTSGAWQSFKRELSAVLEKLEEAEGLEDIEEIKKIARELKIKIRESIDKSPFADKKPQEDFSAQIFSLTEDKEKLFERIAESQVKVSTLREKKKIIQDRHDVLARDLKNIESKLLTFSQEPKQEVNKEEKGAVLKELELIEKELVSFKDKISVFSRTEEEKRQSLFVLQRQIQAIQTEVNLATTKTNEFKVAVARAEAKLEDLENQIRQEVGELKAIRESKEKLIISREEAQEKIKNIKHQLELIGGIDPEAEKEYIKTKERHDFLSSQSQDLESAIKSLEEVIRELDQSIKEQFDREFKEISKKFEEYFKILFNGGSAKIVKIMADEDFGEEKEGEQGEVKDEKDAEMKRIKYLQKHNATGLAGIEIQATPPGKKIQSISMLSGGERALTAIALICAILSANPSPFVIFDEVDAALDEANSDRLSRILDELSTDTQFIVVTHNRASMKRASVLYGVTMQDDGASKLLSIKLEEGEKMVKQN